MKILYFIAFLVPFSVLAQTPPSSLSEHRWEDRIILVGAAKESETLKETLAALQACKADVEERDIVVYSVDFDHKLAKAWNLKDPFTLVLIGKDGTEKLRSETEVDLDTVFELIDSMPMRKSEMKEK